MLSCLSLVLLALGALPALAQDQTARVWAVYAYTVGGEATPKVFPRPRSLTPYGSYQLHEAGAAFRDRYVALKSGVHHHSTRIQNLSPYLIDNDDVNVDTADDGVVIASAQAFMQGVYPPLDESFNSSYFASQLELANGSVINTPLGGYQYPSIRTYGAEDPLSLRLAGQGLCPKHAFANIQYIGSEGFWQTYQESAPFYRHLHSLALSGEFDTIAASYANATTVAEFLDYQAMHNESLMQSLSEEDVKRARWYAGKFLYATNGNTTSSDLVDGSIRVIAGQGQVSSVLNAFESSIQARGALGKMTLQFGSHQTAVSFASLLQLAATNSNFSSSPPSPGASLVLELFSYEGERYPTYPDTSELYVRFLMHNGTTAEFVPFPLFGHSPSRIAIPFTEFRTSMQKMTMGSTADWCQRCDSSVVFCSGAVKSRHSNPSSPQSKENESGGLSNAVAGVIGATVTVAVLTLIAVVGFFACLRSRRGRRISLGAGGLGGFKRNDKAAGDADLALQSPQWGANIKRPTASARGYERHGSWEMNDQSSRHEESVGSPSSLAGELEEWQQRAAAQPAKAQEYL